MFLWLFTLLSLIAPATAISPSLRLGSNTPQIETWFSTNCTYSLIYQTTVTATHCSVPSNWMIDDDRAWLGIEPVWADQTLIVKDHPIKTIGYPNGIRTTFDLTVLQIQQITLNNKLIKVLFAKGQGAPCFPGSSGAIAWIKQNSTWLPIGPMSVGTDDPKITGLPVGWFICGFAL